MIIIGADHAGYELKEKVKTMLNLWNYHYTDVSPEYIADDDYTDVVDKICTNMNVCLDKAIMICGTGIGSSIMANKYNGVRAAICYDEYTAKFTRLHNDANMLCLGGRTSVAQNDELLEKIVKTFLDTSFSQEERHIRRLEKIKEIEEGK